MKIFLSWSGQKSLEVAQALRDWLPSVLQNVEPWLSSEDITKGARWTFEISKALEDSEAGILCVTRENLDSRWLNFEAGALAKRINQSLVCIYLLDLKPGDLTGPLSQFQVSRAQRKDTYQLLLAINNASAHKLPSERLRKIFDLWWPELEAQFQKILASCAGSRTQINSTEEKIDEILEILRRLDETNLGIKVHKDNPSRLSQQKTTTEAFIRPRVFIGSSTEALHIAELIQLGLDKVAECTLWSQGPFKMSQTVVESIVDASAQYDFAVIVLTPDDMTTKRGESYPSARDNVIFELGLFTGALGRARTFMVFPDSGSSHLPSDLAGVTAATYTSRADGNMEAALGPVCTRIKRAMGVA
jgi:predicted nucleotide-binding protein